MLEEIDAICAKGRLPLSHDLSGLIGMASECVDYFDDGRITLSLLHSGCPGSTAGATRRAELLSNGGLLPAHGHNAGRSRRIGIAFGGKRDARQIRCAYQQRAEVA